MIKWAVRRSACMPPEFVPHGLESPGSTGHPVPLAGTTRLRVVRGRHHGIGTIPVIQGAKAFDMCPIGNAAAGRVAGSPWGIELQ